MTAQPTGRPFAAWSERDRRRWEASPSVARWRQKGRFDRTATNILGRLLDHAGAACSSALGGQAVEAFREHLALEVQDSSLLTYMETLVYALRVLRPDQPWDAIVVANRALRHHLAGHHEVRHRSTTAPRRESLALPVDRWPGDLGQRWTVARTLPVTPKVSRGMRFARDRERVAELEIVTRSEASLPPWQWSQAYVARIERGFGLWLCWAETAGLGPLDLDETAAAAFVEAFVHRGAAAVSQASYLFEIWRAVSVIVPERDWRWLYRDVKALEAITTPSRDKRRQLIPIEDLLQLGLDLMRKAMAEPISSRSATQHRDGLLIALASLRPKRVSNLAQMQLGKHVMLGTKGTPDRLSWDRTKNGDASSALVPAVLVPLVRMWLQRFRPALVGAERGKALWQSTCGGALTRDAISQIIRTRTRAAFGIGIGVHMIRSCYATSALAEEPKLATQVSLMLDHRDRRSIDAYRLDARTLQGAKALDASLTPLLPAPRYRSRHQVA